VYYYLIINLIHSKEGVIVNYIAMTDKAIAREMGRRLKSLRLRRNSSQKEVAGATGISVNAVQTAERGESKLITYIKIMRALNSLDSLDGFLPEVTISPLELARLEGKKRKRASGTRKHRTQ
jgi:putative transcriptional regulator